MAFATYQATYSNESLIRNGLRELGCSTAFICSVTPGAPSASLISLWMSGTKNLDDTITARLVETISILKEIAVLCEPWPLSYRDAQKWKELLEDYRKAKEAND